jgi:hypothetical protein
LLTVKRISSLLQSNEKIVPGLKKPVEQQRKKTPEQCTEGKHQVPDKPLQVIQGSFGQDRVIPPWFEKVGAG